MAPSLSFSPPPRRPLIAVASMYRPKWSGDKEGQFTRSVQEFKDLAEQWDFDLHICNQPVISWEDAESTRKELVAAGVDFLMVQISSFSSGDQLLPLLDGGYRIGIWSVPEPSAMGRLPLNSYCGANHMLSVAVLYRQRQDVKWFHGQVVDEFFQHRFWVTLSALRGIKQLEGARIGLIGKPATGFQNIFIDPRKLEQRYGVRFYDHELTEVYSRAQSYSPAERQRVASELIDSVKEVEHELQPLEKIGAIELALLEIAKENGYHGMAVRCWPDWQKEFNIAICTLMSRFNQYGLPMACEGDALGLLGMMLLNGIARFPATLMDMTVFDPDDESILLWHCGPTPLDFAGPEGTRMTLQFNQRLPGAMDMVFKPEHGTIVQVFADGQHLLLLDGQGMGNTKASHDGSRGWFNQLRINQSPTKALDLVNTVMAYGATHHYALTLGDWTDAVLEAASWLDLKMVQPVPYTDYKPFPVYANGVK